MKEVKSILAIALPAMVENFLQMLMGMVDSFLVSTLGLVAISGVSVANNIISIYQAIFIALGAAVSSLLAKALAQQVQAKQSALATESIKVTLVLSLALGLISVFAGRFLLGMLGVEPAVVATGGLYLALIGGSIVLLGFMTTLGALLRALGQARAPMYVSVLANISNILFSALGIFVFQAGIWGVALGTIAARLLGVVLLWRRLSLPLARPSWRWNRELLGLALPAAGERLMMRAGDVVIVGLIATLGTAVIAGNSIGETITQFNYMPGMAVATATVILVARASGQQDSARVGRLVRTGYLLSVLLMLVVSGLVWVGSGWLSGLFTKDSVALAASTLVALYSFIGTPATAGTLHYTAVWQGLGNARLPFYATTIGMWVVRIGLGYLLTVQLQIGLAGVWLATILDNLFRWAFLWIAYQRRA